MKNKKMTREEKRRLLLNKKYETAAERRTEKRAKQMNKASNGRVHFARPSSDASLVNLDSTVVKTTPIFKSMLALILAIVFILTAVPTAVFFTLRGKASNDDYKMGSVTMNVRVNGEDIEETATVQAGQITSSTIDLGDIELPDGAEYVKAVLVDRYTKVETQIFAVGSRGSKNYYSINQNGFTGVEQTNEDILVLVFANKYEVNFTNATVDASTNIWTVNQFGTFTTNAIKDGNDYFIYGGDDLEIKEITPEEDCKPSKVTYYTSSNGTQLNSGSETIKNSAATIPSDMYSGDTLNVAVNFNAISSYTVQDARYMSGSTYYADFYHLDNHGGTSLSNTSMGNSNSLGTIEHGQTKTFYIFSQKTSTSSQVWRLSMISVNGVNLNLPTDSATGNTATTDFRNGTITVTYLDGSYTGYGDSNGTRTLYQIDITDIHENIEVNYYFTNIKQRKVIITGLQGIKQTAAAVEHEPFLDILNGRYYTYTSNTQNVYDAFNDTSTILSISSSNMVCYTVKPGFNPYSYTYKMYYNNVEQTGAIRETPTTGTVDEIIVAVGNDPNTGNFNTQWRYWGQTTNTDVYNYDTAKYGRNELLLTTLASKTRESGDVWYGVALARASAMNQQLYLNINPYPYSISLDPDGGTFKSSTSVWTDSNVHKVTDTNAYMFLPSETPTKEGYIFKGWQLEDSSGEILGSDYIYQPSDRIDLDSTVFDNAKGTKDDATNETVQLVTFKAKWEASQTAYSTTITVNAYKQTGIDTSNENAPTYSGNLINDNTETQIANIGTALIDDYTGLIDDNHYVIASTSTEPFTTTTAGPNVFNRYYDYRTEELTVKNLVFGYPTTTLYPVTITFTPDTDQVVPVDQAAILLSDGTATVTSDATANTVTYKRSMAADDEITLNVPYGWSYSISVAENASDYTTTYDPSNSGTITSATEVEITNIDASSPVDTDKYISGPDSDGNYTLTMESWGTSSTYTKPKKNATVQPLDIALVIDQSGSMTTGDMGDDYEAVDQTTWSVKQVKEYGETLFYREGTGANAKYYPVLLGEGTLYEAATATTVKGMVGGGHDSVVGWGSKPHYNVATSYYYPDSNNVMHSVFFILVGADAHYCSFPYYYVTLNDTYESYNEWSTNTGAWVAFDYPKGDLVNDSTWKTIVNANKVRLIPTSGAAGGITYSTSNLGKVDRHYTWGSDTSTISGLYLPASGTTYNYLYYIDDNGNRISLNNAPSNTGKALASDQIDSTVDGNSDYVVYTEDQVAYKSSSNSNLKLYKATGITRLAALKDAVTDFTQLVANNAKQYNVNHRIALVGFAGNKVPALSGTGNFNSSGYNYKYDFVNTGLFLEGAKKYYYTGPNTTDHTETESGFKNYMMIDIFSSYTGTRYVNSHYYVYNGDANSWLAGPTIYNGSNWVSLDGTTTYSSSDTFYKPNYVTLDPDDDYANALISVSKQSDGAYNGEVADFINTSIGRFGAYGGTYTSYGMTMANHVLDNATDNTWTDGNGNSVSSRKIIIVFTDGEPGGSGYEEAIAGEALSDSGTAKDKGYEVYTVGLYKTNPGDTINTFMSELSSEYTSTAENHYAASGNPTDSNNNGLGTGSNALNADDTYYYYDESDGKTYSVNSKYNGGSSLGWWIHYDSGGYSANPVTPKASSSSSGSGAGTNYFYNASGSIVDPETVNSNHGTVYYASTGAKNPIYYEYRWHDSDGYVVIPKSSDTSAGKQLFKLNFDSSQSNNSYYYRASNASELSSAFQSIADSVYSTTTVMRLTGDNALTRDVLTDNFEKTSSTKVKIESAVGTWTSNDSKPTWGSTTDITNDSNIDWNWTTYDDKTALEVTGFDYSSNYISEHNTSGNGMIITITGLKPTKTGFDIASNMDSSGVYELLYKDDDPSKGKSGEESLLMDFPVPEVNRPQYNLVVDGADTSATYSVKLRLEDASGNAITSSQWAQIANNNPTLTELTFSNGYAPLWSGKHSGDQDDSAILENVFQNLPSGYKVYAKVEGSGTDRSTYNYSVLIDEETVEDNGTTLGLGDEFLITPNNTSIHITSARPTSLVSIREYTTMKDSSMADYTDPSHYFTIKLELKDGNTAVSGTYDGITFDSNGEATIQLRHEQVKTFALPVGCTLDVDVDSDTQENGTYSDTYAENLTATSPTSVDTLSITIAANTNEITVINAMDEIVVTGLLDNVTPLTAILLGVAGALVLAAGGAYVYGRRKKRLTN